MRPASVWPIIFTLLLNVVVACAQSTSIHQQIQQTYNFQPHTLSSADITQKSGVLDQFWTNAKSQPNVYIPALRQELADLRNPPFFLYDGSMLLLSLSDTSLDRKVALAAMARSDLHEVQPKDYFSQVHRMATLNENTTASVFLILEDPNFKVFIPQHVLTLGQNYALVYMLLPTNQDYWLQPAIETAQKSLILVLWYAQTDAAEKAIASFAADASKPPSARDYARQIAQAKDKIGAKQRVEAVALTDASLRRKRRERMKAVSDEALIDLDDYTVMLAAKCK
ncbi:MAG: hypothetical protein DMG93_14180 [Acidobacteria bacterium]|nr:MAG: hypothetical protein DMG93_14180 [Acidobacteriota bacterium]